MTVLLPRQFVERTVALLQAASHPDIATVHTAADAGLQVPPCGIVVTLHDGWRLVAQAVRTARPEGDPEPEDQQRAPVGDPLPPTSGTVREPAIKTRRLLDGIRRLWASDPHIRFGEVTATTSYATNRPHLRFDLTDGGRLYVTVVAVVPPGKMLAGWALHQVTDASF